MNTRKLIIGKTGLIFVGDYEIINEFEFTLKDVSQVILKTDNLDDLIKDINNNTTNHVRINPSKGMDFKCKLNDRFHLAYVDVPDNWGK